MREEEPSQRGLIGAAGPIEPSASGKAEDAGMDPVPGYGRYPAGKRTPELAIEPASEDAPRQYQNGPHAGSEVPEKILLFFLPQPAPATFAQELESAFFAQGFRRLAHGHRCHAFAAVGETAATESLRQALAVRVGVEVSCGGAGAYRFDQIAAYLRLVAALEREVADWTAAYGELVLAELVQFKYRYRVMRPIVFNRDLWRLPGPVRHMLAADNPGRQEQAEEQYLIGDAGQLARTCHGNDLGIDFETQVLTMNKTPVHTRITSHLKKMDLGEPGALMQRRMGWYAAAMAQALDCPLWITGITDLTRHFRPFVAGVLSRLAEPAEAERVRVFKHFSRRWFVRELDAERLAHPGCSIEELLAAISARNRHCKLGY